jgi:hypothetical protein
MKLRDLPRRQGHQKLGEKHIKEGLGSRTLHLKRIILMGLIVRAEQIDIALKNIDMITDDNVFFHEDDYSLIEIIPLQDNFCQSQEKDFFLNCSKGYISKPIADLKISTDIFENILMETALKNITKVYTGYSSERDIVNNCRCFCYENYVLFYRYDNNNKLNKIWINYILLEDYLNVYPSNLEKALMKLGKIFDLLLVDWNEILVLNLRSEEAVLEYVRTFL